MSNLSLIMGVITCSTKNNKLLSKILPVSKKNKDLEKLRSKFKWMLEEQVTVDEIKRIEQRSLYLESIK